MDLSKVTTRAIEEAGGGAKLSRALRIKSRQSVYQWTRIPAEHVHAVERITGIPRHELRPDLYPAEREQVAS